MSHTRGISLIILAAFFFTIGCTRPEANVSNSASLRTWIEEWKGKPFDDFQKATQWEPTTDSGAINNATFRIVEFNAFGPKTSGTSENSMTYHHVTQWSNGKPGLTTTGGANQPLGEIPANATILTETLRFPVTRSGCKLILWVDSKGLISSWRMDGGDCILETMNRLKRQ